MSHTISFRRPELRHVLSTIFVPAGADVEAQIRRLQDLGYQIVDVAPPLDGYGPGHHILDVSPAYECDGYGSVSLAPQSSLFRGAFALRTNAEH